MIVSLSHNTRVVLFCLLALSSFSRALLINPMSPPFRIQIASDLHIEFYGDYAAIPKDIIAPQAPTLALIGDIGLACTDMLQKFLYHQADQFEKVLFLAGNHEYYNVRGSQKTVQEQLEWMRTVCRQRDNLYFMEKDSIEIDGTLILATTLWSDIPKVTQILANGCMNDYNLCYIQTADDGGIRRLSASDTVQWHAESVTWLEHEISNAKQQVVVLTHHTPSVMGTSAPQYIGDKMNSCFSTDLTRLMESPQVVAWCSGHTHWNYDFQLNGTRLLSNQKGYPGHESKGWKKHGGVLEIVPVTFLNAYLRQPWAWFYSMASGGVGFLFSRMVQFTRLILTKPPDENGTTQIVHLDLPREDDDEE